MAWYNTYKIGTGFVCVAHGVDYTGGHWGVCNLTFGPYRRCATSARSKFEVAGTPVATRVYLTCYAPRPLL